MSFQGGERKLNGKAFLMTGWECDFNSYVYKILIWVFGNMCRFIEGDFDAYVTRIQQPYVWGGEPELLMASHVLK